MANAETEHHAPAGRIRNCCGGLGADIGVSKVDVGNPAADRNPLRHLAHQLDRRQYVIIDLGGE